MRSTEGYPLNVRLKPAGLPRQVMLVAGLVSVAALLLEHGFAVAAQSLRWLHGAEILLAGVFVIDRVWMIGSSKRKGQLLRERTFEFGVLILFALLGLGLLFSPGVVAEMLTLLHLESPGRLGIGVTKLFLLANVLVQMLRVQQRMLVRGARPEWVLAGSFALLILAGTLLLLLPRASASPEHPLTVMEAFFTATSASCVTGLTVRDTGADLSIFGQGILLVLFQVGGLGIMTFVAFLAVTSAEALPVPQMLAFRQLVAARSPAVLRRQVFAIIIFTFVIEVFGAVCLFFCLPTGDDVLARIGWSVFHSASAFCNAGFALSANSLTALQAHPGAMLTFMGLIILGGFGFLVVMDVLGLQLSRLPMIRDIPWVRRYNQRVPVYRLPNQTRLAVLVTVILIFGGTLIFWALELSNVMAGKSIAEQFWIASFQSVTTRTAGFNTIPIQDLAPSTLLLMIGLMVVGASPVSCGGGIKTVTFAILILAIRALTQGRQRVEVFGRAVPQRVLLGSLGVVFIYVLVASLGLFAITLCDPHLPLRGLIFEVVSALSTVGLSTGVTAQLSPASLVILCLLMFAGRVGPIALLLSVVRMEQPTRYQYPEEELVVG